MWIKNIKNKFINNPVLVVCGGPSTDHIKREHFANFKIIGTNYAHRIWKCDYLLVIKDYILEEVKNEIEHDKIVCPNFKEDHRFNLFNLSEDPLIINDNQEENYLYGIGGGSCAIHLAHYLGGSPIFVIGMDLTTSLTKKYHSEGYWETTKFKPMGNRTTIKKSEEIFNLHNERIKKIRNQIEKSGNNIYFLSPFTWREYLNENKNYKINKII